MRPSPVTRWHGQGLETASTAIPRDAGPERRVAQAHRAEVARGCAAGPSWRGMRRSDGGESSASDSQASRLSWAELLRRVFEVDVLKCPRCGGGRMKIIATVTDPGVVRKILECIGLPARPPPVPPAREREQGELGFGR